MCIDMDESLYNHIHLRLSSLLYSCRSLGNMRRTSLGQTNKWMKRLSSWTRRKRRMDENGEANGRERGRRLRRRVGQGFGGKPSARQRTFRHSQPPRFHRRVVFSRAPWIAFTVGTGLADDRRPSISLRKILRSDAAARGFTSIMDRAFTLLPLI